MIKLRPLPWNWCSFSPALAELGKKMGQRSSMRNRWDTHETQDGTHMRDKMGHTDKTHRWDKGETQDRTHMRHRWDTDKTRNATLLHTHTWDTRWATRWDTRWDTHETQDGTHIRHKMRQRRDTHETQDGTHIRHKMGHTHTWDKDKTLSADTHETHMRQRWDIHHDTHETKMGHT